MCYFSVWVIRCYCSSPVKWSKAADNPLYKWHTVLTAKHLSVFLSHSPVQYCGFRLALWRNKCVCAAIPLTGLGSAAGHKHTFEASTIHLKLQTDTCFSVLLSDFVSDDGVSVYWWSIHVRLFVLLCNWYRGSVLSVFVYLELPVSCEVADPAVCFLFYGSPADLVMGDVIASVCLLIYALILLSTTYVQYVY